METRNRDEIFSQRIRAGKRTYIFDVKATKGNDYYLTIAEHRRSYDGDGFQKQKIFIYKEDFNKFIRALEDTVEHIKSELMPDYDYDQFDREKEQRYAEYAKDQE